MIAALGLLLLPLARQAPPPVPAPPPTRQEAAGAGARSVVERGPVKLTVALDPARPRLSDEPRLSVEFSSEPGIEVGDLRIGESIPGFVIRDFEEELPREVDGSILRRTVFTLEPLSSGSFRIDPVVVRFRDARESGDGEEHEIRSDPLEVEVATVVQAEMVDLALLRPPAPPRPLPAPPVPLWPWAAGFGSLALVLALAFWLRRGPRRAEQERVLSPRERALAELDALVAADLPAQARFKEFYVRLTAIVRRFIEDDTGVRAPEQTTEEFLRAIHRHPSFDAPRRRDLGHFLEAADLVKFAGREPDGEALQDGLLTARRFLEPPPAPEAQAMEKAA